MASYFRTKLDMNKRYYVIAPNGNRVSVIYAGNGTWQTWSLKRHQWESFPEKYMKVIKQA